MNREGFAEAIKGKEVEAREGIQQERTKKKGYRALQRRREELKGKASGEKKQKRDKKRTTPRK